jgi:hypothetical protein
MALLTKENCAFMLELLLSACCVIAPASNALRRAGREKPARPATRARQNRVRIACADRKPLELRREITERAKAQATLERGYDSKMNEVR